MLWSVKGITFIFISALVCAKTCNKMNREYEYRKMIKTYSMSVMFIVICIFRAGLSNLFEITAAFCTLCNYCLNDICLTMNS